MCPKRLIDGEAIWTSQKLARIEPPWYRAEYTNLLPLALANGSFECDPRLVWARVYGFNRRDISEQDVSKILDEYERVKLLFRWISDEGKIWGYWIGIDKKGRLPPPSQLDHFEVGLDVPQDKLKEWFSGNINNVKAMCIQGKGNAFPGLVRFGKGRLGQGNDPKPSLPGCIALETWSAYLDMRKQIHKPASQHAQKLIIDKLLKLQEQGEDPQAVLEQSIVNSWQGIFPVKKERTNGESQFHYKPVSND